MRSPFSRTSPVVGWRNPDTMSSRVDLPQPEWPIRQTNSPSATDKSTPSSTVWAPRALG